MALTPVKNFDYTKFPDGKRRRYHTASAETILANGKRKQLKIGFKPDTKTTRMRAVVFIDDRSQTEFEAADDFSQSGIMVSLIKNGKNHVPLHGPIPIQYKRLKVAIEPYNKHVTRTRSYRGLAVICLAENLGLMVKVALIKAQA